jgi:hypothetical protein
VKQPHAPLTLDLLGGGMRREGVVGVSSHGRTGE